jgi:uncharacterized protein (DUF58 family)
MQFAGYYQRFQSISGRWTGLPAWARTIVGIFAIPGVILLALSFALVLVSILALLLLTVPVYRLLSAVTSRGSIATPETRTNSGTDFVAESGMPPDFVPASPGRRHIDVKIVEQPDS